MKEKVKKLLSYSSKSYVKYIIIMIKIDVQFKNKTYDDIKNIYRKMNRENTYMIDQYLRIKQLQNIILEKGHEKVMTPFKN